MYINFYEYVDMNVAYIADLYIGEDICGRHVESNWP